MQVDGHEFEDGGCRLECQEVGDETLEKMCGQEGFYEEFDAGTQKGYCLGCTDKLPLNYRPPALRRVESLQLRPELAFDRPDAERARLLRALQGGAAVGDAAVRRVLAGSSDEEDEMDNFGVGYNG